MMSTRKVWIITKSLLLSQLRATSVRGVGSRIGLRSILRRPLILAIIDIVGFALATVIAFYVGSKTVLGPPWLFDLFSNGVRNVIVILPAVILSIILVLGLVLEVSSGAQFATSDTVNWLPVTASEYVAASTLSLLIYYSIFPVVVLSATMSLAYVYGYMGAWELAATLSVFGMVASTSILEIARAVLNRFSTSFYKRGGRAAIALRALSGVIVIILFQALFYPTVYEHFLGVITPNFGPTWIVPLLWAPVAVTAQLNSNLLVSILFSLLAIGFALALFYGAVAARSRYWVPMQPSVRISAATYAPRRGFASSVLSQPQLAIARKDLRGLVRRREMVRLLALPGVFLVVSFLSSANSGGFSFFVYFGMFIVAYTALYVSMSSIGAEGKSIINLYEAPLATKDFVVGKAVTPIVFGSCFGVAFYAISELVVSASYLRIVPLFLLLSIGVAFEMSLVGLMFGTRFPNFSESPRASFVSQTAAILALPVAVLIGGISLSPVLIASVFRLSYLDTLAGFAASALIMGLAGSLFYRFALKQSEQLLSQVPV